jgi:flagellar transcriptional activator FlhD
VPAANPATCTNDVGKNLTRHRAVPDSPNSHSPIQEIFTVDTITYIGQADVSKSLTKPARNLKENFMDSEQLLAEIREANLTYLMLAQNLIRKDRAEALYRLGITEEAADLLGMLSTAQLLKIASSNMLLCRFRVDDDLVWNLLTNHNVKKVDNTTTTQLHASILMAGRFAESMTPAH